MVFTRTKRKAQKVCDELTERGFAVGTVHGDLGQGAREQALRAFRTGKVDVLVATDVAARGIDVDNVTHVVNYECPDDEKTYLHRIGRTGRAGHSGIAVTFVDWEDVARWQMIDRALKLPFKDPIETYSTSDHVYTGLKHPGRHRRHAAQGIPHARGPGRPSRSRISARPARRRPTTTAIIDRTRSGSRRPWPTRAQRAAPRRDGGKREGAKHDGDHKKHHDKAAARQDRPPPADERSRGERRQRRRTKGGQSGPEA